MVQRKALRRSNAWSAAKYFAAFYSLVGVLLFASCQSSGSKGVLAPIDPESKFSVPIHRLAVFPVQNATGRNIVLYSGRGSLVDRVVSATLDKRAIERSGPTANPMFFQQSLERDILGQLRKKGYDLVSPSLVEREYYRISNEVRSVSPFELSLSIPTDAFLMVTVTAWDSEEYLTKGQVRASFDLALIRSGDGEVLWTKKLAGRVYELSDAERSDIPLYKRQDELIADIALRLMKDLPTKDRLNRALKARKE